MVVQLFHKPQLQQVLKDLRAAGYRVEKPQAGMYEAYNGDQLVLRALNGSRAYLVRYEEGLLTPAS